MKKIHIAIFICGLLAACQTTDDVAEGGVDTSSSDNVIHVGGVTTDGLVATAVTARTRDAVDEETVTKTDAENISWLREPLVNGLDITYGLASDHDNTKKVTKLKLITTASGEPKYIKYGTTKYALYDFHDLDASGNETTTNARWSGNGSHYFEGLYVPTNIQNDYVPANLTTDQHDDGDNGNYTLLSRYLGMPSNYSISATVERIKLPFRHRLARVLAYILIDPEMGSNVTIKGYKKAADGVTDTQNEDPTTSSIFFSNVKVLENVVATENNIYTYTPKWTKSRKVIPHFVGERGSYNDKTNSYPSSDVENNFIAFYDTNEKTYIYPTDANWSTVKGKTFDDKNMSSDGFQKIEYNKVPVYDLIVQPTYTSLNNVMYDEENVNNATAKENLYVATNQIDFEITLSNDLHYTKNFVFDLNANYQTVVYLRISKERVDYNSSGSDLWVETKGTDDYYGVNNRNGNTLSFAGNGWQRAYTNAEPSFADNVTDGHFYKWDSEDEKAQYVTDDKWKEMFLQAKEGGAHHGDYFILDHDISFSATEIPADFVFTGHLDGFGHQITLESVETSPAFDEYGTYEDGKGSGITKYVESGVDANVYVEFTPTEGTYYCGRTATEVDPVTYTYTPITDFTDYFGAVAYICTRSDEEPYTYTYNGQFIQFYKVTVHHEAETTEASHLFTGLNGNYTTTQESAQESAQDITQVEWQANVHLENGKWVPYKTDTDGWRAEVINTKINGGKLFKDGATITGYVHSCWQKTGEDADFVKVDDRTPSIPEYK